MSERLEALADRVFDPTSPLACEAAEAIRYAAKLQHLHERSFCARARKVFARVVNRFHGVRS